MFSYRMGRLTRPRFVGSGVGDSMSVSIDAHFYIMYANYALRSIFLIFVLNAATHRERVARERGARMRNKCDENSKINLFARP